MSSPRPTLGCVGSGRLAATVLPLWSKAGWKIATVAGRNPDTTRALASRVKAEPRLDLAGFANAPAVLLLAVPDESVAAIGQRLAATGDWKGRTVLHHAGAFGPELLASLRKAGAAVGVLHPLQVMPRDSSVALPDSTRARCEGDPAALKIARRLARDAGWVALPTRLKWTPATRTDYHIAASMAANDLVALIAAAAKLIESSGATRRDTLDALIPLARGALEQLATQPAGQAVSGPVPRGDVETLEAHFVRLNRRDRKLHEIHRLLSSQVLKLAIEEGRIGERARKRLRKLIAAGRGPRQTV
jgi:predicted short-subunit dehydrogenase-like oxidoreductase (DUF2520 family)